MLLVKAPDRGLVLSVLSGLVAAKLTREEVVAWYEAIVARYQDIEQATGDGYWYFRSLSALTIPMNLGDGESLFVRDRDIREYLLDMQRVDSAVTVDGITRVRCHQTNQRDIRWPLIMFPYPDAQLLERRGLPPVRGIFDRHGDLVEHTHLLFRGALYLVVRQYDDQAHQVMVLGTSRDEGQLRDFLAIVGFQ